MLIMLAMSKAEFGIIGLGVMGKNFLINVAKSGIPVVGFDLDGAKREALSSEASGMDIKTAVNLDEFFAGISGPRAVMLFVPENLVDEAIAQCLPHIEAGDLLIDGGNSHFSDTERRSATVRGAGGRYMGAGVSGGEEGARNGACIMAGGDREDFDRVRKIFEQASAKVEGAPCAALVGAGSAGHFVKMVHNGIEYGMMQIIAEAFDSMRRIGGLSCEEASDVFGEWTEGRLGSFLVEITRDVLSKKDDETGGPLVEVILDKAAQKGTGKWTSQAAMDLGVPIPTIDAAVRMRQISFYRELRQAASRKISVPRDSDPMIDPEPFLKDLEAAVFGSFVSVYTQGFSLLAGASAEKGYGLDYGEITKIWRGGCIIRSRMLDHMVEAFNRAPALENLLLDEGFASRVSESLPAWRRVVALMVQSGIPSLALTSAIGYVEAMTAPRLPADLIQAQRDYFGAHTYERTDRPGKFHTTDWKKEG